MTTKSTTRHKVSEQDGIFRNTDVADDNSAAYPAVATSGDQSVGGRKTFTKMPQFPVNANLAATGSTQANSVVATTGITKVTAADNAKGVVLGSADATLGEVPAAGNIFLIWNSDATHTLKVWPPLGGAVNAGAANAAYVLTAACAALLVDLDGTGNFFTLPLLGS